jgi:hypothetical protein
MNATEQNQFDKQNYLNYCERVKQNCKETVSARENQLRYLMMWSGETPFPDTPKIQKGYPLFLTE